MSDGGMVLMAFRRYTADATEFRGTTVSWTRYALAFSLLVIFGGPALAQEPVEPSDEVIPDPENPEVFYKKKTEFDFEDDIVEGSFVRPEGEYLDARRGGRYSSLIRIRENFVPEMLKSAEDI